MSLFMQVLRTDTWLDIAYIYRSYTKPISWVTFKVLLQIETAAAKNHRFLHDMTIGLSNQCNVLLAFMFSCSFGH